MVKKHNGFQRRMLNPFLFKLFLLFKLPMAFLAGLKLKELAIESSLVTMRYKYLNKNPFGSIYFACLSMAGELASGILAASIIYDSKPKVSMLVVNLEVSFVKKAIGVINFKCEDGLAMQSVIDSAITSGEGRIFNALTTATDSEGDLVAEFIIRWSFKAKP
tara:strand:+ start:64 stop:549 length:486 start_codon:yes stop_codon:yes gene_type:complete